MAKIENKRIAYRKWFGWSDSMSLTDFVSEKYKAYHNFDEFKDLLLSSKKIQISDHDGRLLSEKEINDLLNLLEEQILLKEEEIVFFACKKNKNFEDYFRRYVNISTAKLMKEAKELHASYEEEKFFNANQKSISDIKKYVEKYENGIYIAKAEELYYRKIKTFSEIQDYFLLFSDRKYEDWIEKDLYKIIIDSKSIGVCKFYINKFPLGRNSKRVIELLRKLEEEEKLLSSTKDLPSVKKLLEKFPEKKRQIELQNLFIQLVSSEKLFIENRSYLANFTWTKEIEEALFNLIKRIESSKAGRFYLKNYANGRFKKEVEIAIKKYKKPVKLFISYSHKDKDFKDELVKNMSSLRRRNEIDIWQDEEILAGKDFEKEIFANLNQSEIICLLVSPDFINSDYCYSKELSIALERHKRYEAYVIPIIIRPSLWQKLSFGHLQVLPEDGKAVTTWVNRDSAWTDAVKSIERLLDTM